MTAFAIWLKAMIRRILTVAGSAILTYIIANWQGWVNQGIAGDEKAMTAWPLILLIFEAIQKALRAPKEANK